MTDSLDLVERWDAAHARYLERDDVLHAVITWNDDARAEVENLEIERRRGESRGSLHGLLVGVKDNIDTNGVRTTAGAAALRDNIPQADATVIRRLRAAGAVVSAKLNLAEFAWGATTQNATYGACRNPWDTDRIPGGSSGGSGVALIAGYCDLALGTDTGASVRIPSAVNGVIGIRPSFGSIPNDRIFPTSLTQDTVGPMGRDAALTARLTAVITGYERSDPYSVRMDAEPADARLGIDIVGLRVGIPETFFFDGMDSGVGARLDDFIAWLAAAGAVLVPVPDFGQAEAFAHWSTIVPAEGASFHEQRLADDPGGYSADVYGRLTAGLAIPGSQLARSLAWRAGYRRRLGEVFGDYDIMVTPTIAVDVPKIDGLDSRAQTAALGAITYPWALHDGPTLNLPVGFHDGSGMPVGAALAAAVGAESVLYQVAHRYQRDTDWHRVTPANYL
ncbi:MAG: amidase [Rhodoglobus sp.]